MKLHLCCGDVYLGGYINCDITGTLRRKADHTEPPTNLDNYYQGRCIGKRKPNVIDQKMDLTHVPWKFMAESVEEVVMISAIEHFTLEQAKQIVNEVWRVLVPGGIFLVDFPDIEETVKRYMQNDPEFGIRLIYGSHRDENAYHAWGYTPETFRNLLGGSRWKRVDFGNIVEHDYPVIGCKAEKLYV